MLVHRGLHLHRLSAFRLHSDSINACASPACGGRQGWERELASREAGRSRRLQRFNTHFGCGACSHSDRRGICGKDSGSGVISDLSRFVSCLGRRASRPRAAVKLFMPKRSASTRVDGLQVFFSSTVNDGVCSRQRDQCASSASAAAKAKSISISIRKSDTVQSRARFPGFPRNHTDGSGNRYVAVAIS